MKTKGARALLWALAAAVLLGLGLRAAGGAWAEAVCLYVLMPLRTMYLAALKLVVGPLVFCMIGASVAGLSDYKAYGRIGAKVAGLYIFTSAVACAVGLAVALWLRPGAGQSPPSGGQAVEGAALSLTDTLVGIVPDNLLAPFVNANMIQIIFLALLLGVTAGLLEQRKGNGRARRLLEGLRDWVLTAAELVLRLLPLGIFCAVALLVADINAQSIVGLLRLIGCVLLGVAAMFLFYSLLFLLGARKNPWRLWRLCAPNLLSFALLCSTSAVMPQSLDTCTKKLGVDPAVSSFSMPLGSTVNMDGACVYLTVSALFLAQLYGLPLSVGQLLTLGLTTLLLSVGAPPVPGAGFVCLSVLVSQLGLPMEGIGALLGIDALMSALRTVTNGAGDFVVTAVVAAGEGRMDEDVFFGRKEFAQNADT